MQNREAGQATPLLAVVVLVVALVVLGLARTGGDAVDLARAATAADASALAGVAEGRAGAAQVAARNGAELVSYRELGTDVAVVVRIHRALGRARARASRGGSSG